MVTLTHAHISAQLHAAGLAPRRALGQNFVVDANTVRRIARLCGVGPADSVLEIGAGLGSLTLALAESGAHITAIEIDQSIVPLLRDNVAGCSNVTVVQADAMTLDWSQLADPSHRWHLVANLPYNVATPMIADILDTVPQIKEFFVMVQREVGERLAGAPRTKAYGAVSVKVAFWGQAEVVGMVPASVFLPKPNVESALVRIVRHSEPLDISVNPTELFSLVRTGFAKRRKMLRGALASVVTQAQFNTAGIESTARAEELSVHDWIRLYKVVHAEHA
ncbi:MAG: 16S rRNA (adenine(1518)-N(6)/adenine(1519)-N(6))-dimethyltransferase RsmA [Ilumatobacteraceae bacterium]|nr:16S rRNA (adenine(1518)-N(6)/adenine(1519)-N(6))-dimethyltransferase RsmA [Ilumatobacteraceae bacterium]